MLKRTSQVKDNVDAAAELAAQLARDRKFRKQLLAASGHGVRAQRRARRQIGVIALVSRLAADEQLRDELQKMVGDLQDAWTRIERKRSHRTRNTLIALGAAGAAAAAAVPSARQWLTGRARTLDLRPRRPNVIDAEIEVDVPVSTAYNQWTQFEEFPLFMEGVDDVRQLDDTRLHWVVTVAGKQAEWDAKILEQHPDRQISWVSEDGRKTRGTVSFEQLGPSRTRVRLSMSYHSEGAAEAVGSAAGLDNRRVRADLERFKELLESRGAETGAWRGDVSAGTTR